MKQRNLRNYRLGNNAVRLVIKRLAALGITAQQDNGSWGAADLTAIYNTRMLHIEVKSAALIKAHKGTKRLNSISISDTQLQSLKDAESNGKFAIILLVLRTQRKTILSFMFPGDVSKAGELPLTKALDIAISLRYLPVFLEHTF